MAITTESQRPGGRSLQFLRGSIVCFGRMTHELTCLQAVPELCGRGVVIEGGGDMGVIEYSSLTRLRCWQQNFTISSYNLNNQALSRYANVPILPRCSLYEFCPRQLWESHPGPLPSRSLTFLPRTSVHPQTSPFIPVPFKSTPPGPLI